MLTPLSFPTEPSNPSTCLRITFTSHIPTGRPINFDIIPQRWINYSKYRSLSRNVTLIARYEQHDEYGPQQRGQLNPVQRCRYELLHNINRSCITDATAARFYCVRSATLHKPKSEQPAIVQAQSSRDSGCTHIRFYDECLWLGVVSIRRFSNKRQ